MELAEYRRMAEVENSHWWYGSTRALLRELLAGALATGGRFLDIGCGTGATGGWLAEHGTVVACDVEPEALVLHRERHAAAGHVLADAQALPFAAGSFDLALCVTVLCHRSIRSVQHVVDDLARVVRPGGVVCLWEPGVRRLRRSHDRVTHTGRRFARNDLAVAAVNAGLQVERTTGAYSYLIPPAVVKAMLERGRVASDLDRHRSGLGGVLRGAAATERAVLRRTDLPIGLSVVTVARRTI